MSIKVITQDDKIVVLNQSFLKYFVTIKEMVDDIGIDNCTEPIPIPNIYSCYLEKMIEWVLHYIQNNILIPESPMTKNDRHKREWVYLEGDDNKWNVEFAKNIPFKDLVPLVMGANYLGFSEFREFICQVYAKHIVSKVRPICNDESNSKSCKQLDDESRAEMCTFDPEFLKDDLTPEEKEKIANEHKIIYTHPPPQIKQFMSELDE